MMNDNDGRFADLVPQVTCNHRRKLFSITEGYTSYHGRASPVSSLCTLADVASNHHLLVA
ncbi:hypothetical protein DPMN_074832 [Dreissena polymorpha]|uniref:Uncharacterized protein n=1 Tax=Dreissena polymorpha TaxID=45954 RepID=A0A9D4BED7_DREPO|nr:hypothetical protein DPMN_074832 [Dreissena polymorpha]